MANAIGGPERLARAGREVLTAEVERALLEEVLGYAQSGEVQELQNAWAIGLVSDREALAIQNEMEARYRQEIQEYPRHVWSFAEKSILIKTGKLYEIVRDVARGGRVVSHSELSDLYNRVAGDRPHPRKAWGKLLQLVNGLAAASGLPPLSAVVICGDGENWPGTEPRLPDDNFWGAAGVVVRPEDRGEREAVWRGILNDVHRAAWPERLQGVE